LARVLLDQPEAKRWKALKPFDGNREERRIAELHIDKIAGRCGHTILTAPRRRQR
jgi:hypothetical protein